MWPTRSFSQSIRECVPIADHFQFWDSSTKMSIELIEKCCTFIAISGFLYISLWRDATKTKQSFVEIAPVWLSKTQLN